MKRTGAAVGGIAAVLASLVVVALASRGDPGDRTAAAFEAATVGRTIFLSVLGVAFLVCAALAVWALWPDGSGTPRPTPPSRWLPYLVVTVLILLLAVLAPERPPLREGADAPASAMPPEDLEGDADESALDGRASPTASLLLTALAVAGLVAFTLVVRRRRDDARDAVDAEAARVPEVPSPLAPDLAASIGAGDVDTALAAVAAEPDPRRAVLLAYAVLDARLATTGAARARTSTPTEWLRRIRSVFSETAPAVVDGSRSLTTLYERARFGNGAMTDEHRAEALLALEPLRRLPFSEAVR